MDPDGSLDGDFGSTAHAPTTLERNGYHEFRAPNGDFYKGEWLHDEMHGQGSIVYALQPVPGVAAPNPATTIKSFVGEFRHNVPLRGVATYLAGGKYEGELRVDRRVGEGAFTDLQGVVFKGSFREDILVGPAEITWPDGAHYKGSTLPPALHTHECTCVLLGGLPDGLSIA